MNAGEDRANARGRRDLRHPVLGTLALSFYLVHAAHHFANGTAGDAFWACHLGALLVGVGLLIGRRLPCAVGFLWLCVGDVFWALDLATGGELIPTSLLTHIGGLLVGGIGIARIGVPPYSAVWAIAAFFALQQVSRLLTQPTTNLNLAHAVWPGWEASFPDYRIYQVLLLAIGFAGFLAVEWLTRLWLDRSGAGVVRHRTAE